MQWNMPHAAYQFMAVSPCFLVMSNISMVHLTYIGVAQRLKLQMLLSALHVMLCPTAADLLHHQALWCSRVCHYHDHTPVLFHSSLVTGLHDTIVADAMVSRLVGAAHTGNSAWGSVICTGFICAICDRAANTHEQLGKAVKHCTLKLDEPCSQTNFVPLPACNCRVGLVIVFGAMFSRLAKGGSRSGKSGPRQSRHHADAGGSASRSGSPTSITAITATAGPHVQPVVVVGHPVTAAHPGLMHSSNYGSTVTSEKV